MEDKPVVVMVVTSSEENARAIARMLVKKRLAACVQALPIASTYRWDGEIESAAEVLLLVKTRAGVFSELEAAIVDMHPYDVPEIVSVPTGAVHAPYRDWLVAEWLFPPRRLRRNRS